MSIEPHVRPVALAPLLMLSMTVSTIVIPSLGVLAPFVVDEFDISRAQFGLLITSIAGVTAATSPLAGRAADWLGGRRLVLIASIMIAVSTTGMALAPTLLGVVLIGMATGLPNASGNPAANKIIVDQLPVGQRGTTIGLKQSGVQLGFFSAGMTLPALALRIGWRGSFLVLATFGLIMTAVLWRMLPEDPPRPLQVRSENRYRHPPDVRLLAVYSVLMGAAGSPVTTFLPLYSQEALGFSPTTAGATVSLLGVVGIGARVVMARAVERIDSFLTPLAGLALMAAASIAVVLLASLWRVELVWAAALLAGVSVVAWNVIANLAAISAVDAPSAGRASGLVNFGFMAGFTVGPAAFGTLVDLRSGYDLAWAAVIAVFLLASVVMGGWTMIRPPAPALTAQQPRS